MRIIFYYDERSLNDATLYYIKIIEKSVNSLGGSMLYKIDLKDVEKSDIIFTITGKSYLQAKIKKPFSKTIYWSQGVGPEEYYMYGGSFLKFKMKSFMEFVSIKTSNLVFMVSDRMLKHYNEKYKYSGSNFMIMPCYNLDYETNLAIETSERYDIPSFVYAGALNAWQCIDKTLLIFKEFQYTVNNATLTLLVKEKQLAHDLIKKYNLNSVEVKYVKLSELQDELKRFKYGFIIRENNIVNNVATPTKMNSYLASGVIPIFTDALDSFANNITLGSKHTLCMSSKESVRNITKTLLNFDKNKISVLELDKDIQFIFDNYYNDNFYIKKIKDLFIQRFT